jgi:hypothetical protein
VLTVSRLADDAGHGASVTDVGLLVLLVAVLALVALGAIRAWHRWASCCSPWSRWSAWSPTSRAASVRVLLLGVFFWAISARWERFE